MQTSKIVLAASSLCLAVLTLAACDLFGGGTGACVSTPVEFSFGLRVYCQNEFDEDECSDYDSQQVNGADWEFHSGQTCSDRDLDEGSNPWP